MTADPAWETLLRRHARDEDLVAVVDSDFVLRATTPAVGRLLDIDPTSVIGKSTTDLIHPDDILRALDVFRGSQSNTGLRPPNIYRIRTDVDDIYRTFGVTTEVVLEGAATILRLQEPSEQERSDLLAVEQIDILEMMGNGRSLHDCLLALVIMVERNSGATRAVIHIADDEGLLEPVSSGSVPDAVLDRFRGKRTEAPPGSLGEALRSGTTQNGSISHPKYSLTSATVARRPNGDVAGYLELIHPRRGGTNDSALGMQRLVCRLIGLVFDRYVLASDLSEASLLDDLTGLPNRQALSKTTAKLDEAERPYGVLVLDLDDFAAINQYGHDVGDRTLRAVGQAVQRLLPGEATIFRPGGDEFVVIVPDERREEVMARLGEEILDAVTALASELAIRKRRLRVSIGATTTAEHEPFSELLGRADLAMRVAKRDGGHQIRLHDQPLDSRWVHRRALAESLPNALKAGELYLEFQPIISLNSHYVVGFEALTRWQHPRFGALSPADFLPIAEETSLIHSIDTWVLNTAAASIASWNRASRRPLDIWVNLSARSLARDDLIEQIVGLQRHHNIRIGVELTERDSFASSFHADAACEQLQAAGIRLALDDFGAGRSSLYRAVFHGPSVLKIDRSFVDGMLASEAKMAMVSTILDLGRQLDLDVIAEGVESEEQMRQLEIMGCDLAQGYLFAPPLTARVIEQRLGPNFDDLRVVLLSSPGEASDNLNV